MGKLSDSKMQFVVNYGAISYNPEMLSEIQVLAAWKGMLAAAKKLTEEEIETSKAIARGLNDLHDCDFFERSNDEKQTIINLLVDEYRTTLEIQKLCHSELAPEVKTAYP